MLSASVEQWQSHQASESHLYHNLIPSVGLPHGSVFRFAIRSRRHSLFGPYSHTHTWICHKKNYTDNIRTHNIFT